MSEHRQEFESLEASAEKLVSLAEAADLCGLSHSHLRKLAREGKISAQQIGRYWVTTEEAVREYLQQDRRPGPKPKDR